MDEKLRQLEADALISAPEVVTWIKALLSTGHLDNIKIDDTKIDDLRGPPGPVGPSGPPGPTGATGQCQCGTQFQMILSELSYLKLRLAERQPRPG